MASRTRVPTKHIDAILAAIDISDRWNRLLGKIDLQRYLGVDCGLVNPIHTQLVVGGAIIDPRDRNWTLNQLTDSVQVTPVAGALFDVSDRWARQLGQIDLARVLGAALSAANPVISGIYDTLGNRMPAMDAVARPGYMDVIDRAARLLGVVYGSEAQQILQRALTFDLLVQLRTAGVEYDARQIRALTAADIVTVQNFANPLPVTLATLLNPHPVSLTTIPNPSNLDIAVSLLARETTLGDCKTALQLIDNMISGNEAQVDVITLPAITGTLTQSTKHDAKTYLTIAGGSAADAAQVIAAVANKVIKIHRMTIQAAADGATPIYLYEETSGNLVTGQLKLNDREGVAYPFVPAPACIGQTTTVNKKVLLKNTATKQVYWDITYSADDAA